ncbi:MAG TPA: 4a-hydroxytetrahydrobiopterin dehydratase [Chloroflexi bacterium]|jgi:4a-hydroxytetrahydrobiopterin dehydratase|nr:4a-hydroxytetrahydrobiopterin dehydratase [Chloroflexota bacterium]
MSSTPLSAEQVRSALQELEGWTYDERRLTKTFRFGGFPEAIAFIVRLAFEAEALDHHPDLHNVYNRVEIALSTHEAGDRVTERDIRLARAIDALATR